MKTYRGVAYVAYTPSPSPPEFEDRSTDLVRLCTDISGDQSMTFFTFIFTGPISSFYPAANPFFPSVISRFHCYINSSGFITQHFGKNNKNVILTILMSVPIENKYQLLCPSQNVEFPHGVIRGNRRSYGTLPLLTASSNR